MGALQAKILYFLLKIPNCIYNYFLSILYGSRRDLPFKLYLPKIYFYTSKKGNILVYMILNLYFAFIYITKRKNENNELIILLCSDLAHFIVVYTILYLI